MCSPLRLSWRSPSVSPASPWPTVIRPRAIIATDRPAAGRGFAHSLVPNFAPHPRAWLRTLSELSRTPPHTAKPVQKPKPRRSRSPPAGGAKQQPRPQHQLKTTTLSIYEQTAKARFLAAQGCHAARRHETGVVILDFGKPAFAHGGYGTLLFSGRFAPNHKITTAMLRYARGYVHCLPKGSTASIELARGTSNYHPSVPSAYEAGVRWARETNKLGRELHRRWLGAHVEAAAADDAEPAWDPAVPPDAAVLPRLPRGGARAHALRLRLARRRSRRGLERAAGVVRRRRAPPHEGAARDLQLRDGAGVGGAGADRPRPIPPRRPLRGRDDAGHARAATAGSGRSRRTTPSRKRSAPRASATSRCPSAARTSSVRGGRDRRRLRPAPVSRAHAFRIRSASAAAFFALSTPTAATGTPGGICAIASSASRPSSTLRLERSGTPITGRSVCAATAPGSAADSPAPQMSTRSPRSRALRAYSATASGVRCADRTSNS